MTHDELLAIELPKWPAMVVHGEPVTKEQAAEIIVRTDNWFLQSNDKEWLAQVHELAGIRTRIMNDHVYADIDSIKEFHERMGVLFLDMLTTERIATSHVDGPNGWCDWNGRIFQNDGNIGKWPHVDRVLEEWQYIATAFPYLDLTAQLFDQEWSESGEVTVSKALVEYRVQGGTVLLREPTAIMRPRTYVASSWNPFEPGRERGCTLEQLRQALELVKEKA